MYLLVVGLEELHESHGVGRVVPRVEVGDGVSRLASAAGATCTQERILCWIYIQFTYI